jgi:hypothetical protein
MGSTGPTVGLPMSAALLDSRSVVETFTTTCDRAAMETRRVRHTDQLEFGVRCSNMSAQKLGNDGIGRGRLQHRLTLPNTRHMLRAGLRLCHDGTAVQVLVSHCDQTFKQVD